MRQLPPLVKRVLISAVIILAIAVISYISADIYNPGQVQPIPFSHRIHATTKDINCFFCHPGAANSSSAGMPSVDKCMLCHKVIASKFAPIQKLNDYSKQKKGIPWVRVTQLPDFVHFSHQVHIARGQDCSECHGNIKAMDRVKIPRAINMDLCTSCHNRNKARVDCYICHY